MSSQEPLPCEEFFFHKPCEIIFFRGRLHLLFFFFFTRLRVSSSSLLCVVSLVSGHQQSGVLTG